MSTTLLTMPQTLDLVVSRQIALISEVESFKSQVVVELEDIKAGIQSLQADAAQNKAQIQQIETRLNQIQTEVKSLIQNGQLLDFIVTNVNAKVSEISIQVIQIFQLLMPHPLARVEIVFGKPTHN